VADTRRRKLFVWEKELENQLMVMIDSIQWNKFEMDTWSWMGEETTSYTIQSGYRAQEPVLVHLSGVGIFGISKCSGQQKFSVGEHC